jgi:hypothetical protein
LGLIGGFSISALLFTIVRKDGQPEYRTILLVLIGSLVVIFIALVLLQVSRIQGI